MGKPIAAPVKIGRPLKVLVPLIKVELERGDAAGLEHYRKVFEMLLEAKDQVPLRSWSRWLKNFELDRTTARRVRDEIQLDRKLVLQLVNLGYRALATRLHPDRGGSKDAMTRLYRVRDKLKSTR